MNNPTMNTIMRNLILPLFLLLALQASAIPTVSSVRNASATGVCDGAITLTGIVTTGVAAPIRFLWSNGRTTQNISGLCASTYTVTCTNNQGCAMTLTATVGTCGVGANAITIGSNVSPVCPNQSGGTVWAFPSGGTAGYTWQWSNGSTAALAISNVPVGGYRVTITDARGCRAAGGPYQVSNAPAMTLYTGNGSACNGNNAGSATSFVSGGTAPFNWTWSTPQAIATTYGTNINTATGLSAGSYTVTVSDKYACTATASYIVPNITLGVALSYVHNATLTSGQINRAVSDITATPSAPSASLRYLWSNGRTTQTLDDVPNGTYSVTVTNPDYGCSATATIRACGVHDHTTLITADYPCTGASVGTVQARGIDNLTCSYRWRTPSGIQTMPTVIASFNSTFFWGLTITEPGTGCVAYVDRNIYPPSQLPIMIQNINKRCTNYQASYRASVSTNSSHRNVRMDWVNQSNGQTFASSGNNDVVQIPLNINSFRITYRYSDSEEMNYCYKSNIITVANGVTTMVQRPNDCATDYYCDGNFAYTQLNPTSTRLSNDCYNVEELCGNVVVNQRRATFLEILQYGPVAWTDLFAVPIAPFYIGSQCELQFECPNCGCMTVAEVGTYTPFQQALNYPQPNGRPYCYSTHRQCDFPNTWQGSLPLEPSELTEGEIVYNAGTTEALVCPPGYDLHTFVCGVNNRLYRYCDNGSQWFMLNRTVAPSNSPDVSNGGSLSERGGDVSVYPNPFNNILSIDFQGRDLTGETNVKIVFTDINGLEIIKQDFEVSGNFPIIELGIPSELSNGTYLLRVIEASNESSVFKVIRLKN